MDAHDIIGEGFWLIAMGGFLKSLVGGLFGGLLGGLFGGPKPKPPPIPPSPPTPPPPDTTAMDEQMLIDQRNQQARVHRARLRGRRGSFGQSAFSGLGQSDGGTLGRS